MSAAIFVALMTSFTVLVCGFAFWKGGPGERIASAVILGVLLVQLLVKAVVPPEIRPLLSLAFDAAPAVALLLLVLRFGSPWLGAVMLFYACQFALQALYLVTERPIDTLYAHVNNFNFLGIHVCLVIGAIAAWRHRLRERRASAAAA